MQTEITIRLVLPEGTPAPDPEAGGSVSLCHLVGALVYTLFPAGAQEVECDIDVAPLEPDSDPADDLVAPAGRGSSHECWLSERAWDVACRD